MGSCAPIDLLFAVAALEHPAFLAVDFTRYGREEMVPSVALGTAFTVLLRFVI
jgi:hypothetical protein